MGLPIVTAAVGGPSKILEHGRTGILCPPKNAEALGDAILKLLMNAHLRRRIGVAAVAEVRRRGSICAVAACEGEMAVSARRREDAGGVPRGRI